MQRRSTLAHALLFVMPCLWSANYIVARSAIDVVAPHMLAFLRWGLAFLLMLAFQGATLRRRWPAWRGEWRDMLVMGGLGMWICGAFVYLGARTTSVTNMSLLYAVAPAMIAAASAFWFGDRLGATQWAGVALAIAGTLAVIFKGQVTSLAGVRFSSGDLWMVAAVIAWTLYSLMLRGRPTVLDPFARLTMIAAGGLVVLAPLTLVEGAMLGWPTFGAKLWTLVIVAALLPAFGAYLAYSWVQRELGAARAALALYIQPLYAALLAWLLLGEPPQWYHALGAALILPGIWMASRRVRVTERQDG